jgi:hypothetical protein
MADINELQLCCMTSTKSIDATGEWRPPFDVCIHLALCSMFELCVHAVAACMNADVPYPSTVQCTILALTTKRLARVHAVMTATSSNMMRVHTLSGQLIATKP